MKISYDDKGDILEVQFTPGQPEKRTGIGLTDNITIFCDTLFEQTYGFIAVAYSKLVVIAESPLTELNQAPQDVQDKIRQLILKTPLNRFFYLSNGNIGLKDIKISETLVLS